MRNFYLLLGIPVTATDAEVKKAFRREARETHPDSVGGSGERFQNVKEAHETLGDPEKRRRYDSERAAWAKRIGACICVVCGSANTIRRRPKNGETVVCAGCQSPLPIDLNSAINLQKIRLASEADRKSVV